jgi:branched-chain amino acid transport system substrate-binding protein
MVRLGNLLKRTLAPGALCVLAVTACGSQKKSHVRATKTTTASGANNRNVWIYSSLPDRGPGRAEATQIRAGIRLALGPLPKHYQGFLIDYRVLNDSFIRLVSHHGGAASPSTGDKSHDGTVVTRSGNTNGWNPSATIANAERAARNPKTVAFIGELDSAATELSLPILNQAGIVQITPGSGYPGLTDSYSPAKGVITAPGEPGRYYPQTPRNLLRMIPSDVVQASAALSALHKGGCQAVAAWQFAGTTETAETAETAALLNAVVRTAPLYGMKYVAPPKLPPSTKDYVNYAGQTLKPLNIRCAVFVGRVTPAAEMLTLELREQLGTSVPIVGTSGFCNASWARGIPKRYATAVVPGLYCTTPALPVNGKEYPGSSGFVTKFRSIYNRPPTAYGYYGYLAAEMVLRALHDAADAADPRSQVLDGLVQEFVPEELRPPLTFSNGSVESTRYGVDRFTARGLPAYYETVAPSPIYLLPSAG